MRETRSTCPYCGVGCGVIIESDAEGRIAGVRGDPEHPANFGRLCTKGSTLHLTASVSIMQQARALFPTVRDDRGGPHRRVSWPQAIEHVADRLAQVVDRHGPDALGIYVSGQLLTEDYYVFNKLAKGLLGSNQIDTNSRLCMSSAVAGYKRTLGADAPPACYEDLDHADTLFIAGSNAAYAHPILFRRIEDARRARPGMKMVVVDPRRTDTAEQADLHLAILPGTDVILFHGMLHLMLWEGLVDAAYIEEHTHGFEALRNTVKDLTPREAARQCGIEEADLIQAARWFAGRDSTGPTQRRATLSLYCQGLNQSRSGTDKNAALINLHLATGQIGRVGAGPFSLTGQPNAMGGREVGGLANLLSAHRDLANPVHRAELARLWGVPEVPAEPGRTAVEMFDAAARGEVKALWIVCTNPAQSLPDQNRVHEALRRCEFVIVQEAYTTPATCDYADVLLPAASWGEKDGTVTNSERRISRVRAAVASAGESRADWAIGVDVARALERRWPERRRGQSTLFPYANAESVWNEHRETTRGRDLDITGLSYELLDREGPQQWPMPSGARQGRQRLYTDGIFATEDGKARFAAVTPRALAEPRDASYPFSLITGRLRDQWHGMSRTGTLGRLWGHAPEPSLDMHPQDMQRLRVKEGDFLRIRSRHGELTLPVRAEESLRPSQVFVAMHWGAEVLGGRDAHGAGGLGVNVLTTPAFCPQSKQPELKHAAVHLEKIALDWRVLALAWLPASSALRVRAELRGLMRHFEYACCVPFGREPNTRGVSGVMFRAAHPEPVEASVLQKIESLLGLDGEHSLHYADRRQGQRRSVRLQDREDGHQTLDAFLLAGDTRAEPWIRTLLQEEQAAEPYGRLILRPGSSPPIAVSARGRQVCSCLDVREPEILAALPACPGSPETRLALLQQKLRCGTQCGSCVPELRRIIAAHPEREPTSS